MASSLSTLPNASSGARRFGRFELAELIGRSQRTMAWRVRDSRDGTEKVLVAPRLQLPDDGAVTKWIERAGRASRLSHPNVLRPVEIGEQQRWPYLLYLPEGRPLSSRLTIGASPGVPQEVTSIVVEAGRALARAHDAGVVHGDFQSWSVWLVGKDRVRLIGLEAAAPLSVGSQDTSGNADSALLREGAARDITGIGVLMHWLLTGQRPLGQEDLGEVVDRLAPPLGQTLQLPEGGQLVLPRAIKVICNRATVGNPSYRYRSMRTLVTALEGWLDERHGAKRGFLHDVREKLRSAGGFPISNAAVERFSSMDRFEEERSSLLAEMLLEELPVAIELLRSINARQQRDERRAGTASVLTLKRAVALFGLMGVRRVALGLKRWPGTLKPHETAGFHRLLERCQSAGRVAQGLRPAGFDAEIVFVVTLLQNLGRVVLQYHYPEQAAYVHSVMFRPSEPTAPQDGRAELDMNEETACLAVLGVDMDAISRVALQYIGLDDEALSICRRMPLGSPIHMSRKDDDLLRMTASCAIEAVDALQWPADRASLELTQVMQRYGKVLKVDLQAMKRLLMPHGLGGETLRAWVRRTPYAVPDQEDDLM